MTTLDEQEQELLNQALSVYLEVMSQQAPQDVMAQCIAIAQSIVRKIQSAQNMPAVSNGENTAIPNGITQDQFSNCCTKGCTSWTPQGCTEKVTLKFPGKCDTILTWEFNKSKQVKKALDTEVT